MKDCRVNIITKYNVYVIFNINRLSFSDTNYNNFYWNFIEKL